MCELSVRVESGFVHALALFVLTCTACLCHTYNHDPFWLFQCMNEIVQYITHYMASSLVKLRNQGSSSAWTGQLADVGRTRSVDGKFRLF